MEITNKIAGWNWKSLEWKEKEAKPMILNVYGKKAEEKRRKEATNMRKLTEWWNEII